MDLNRDEWTKLEIIFYASQFSLGFAENESGYVQLTINLGIRDI